MGRLTDREVEEQLEQIRNQAVEAQKFYAELRKLDQEAPKLQCETILMTAPAFATIIGGALGFASFVAQLLQRH